jgi:hypothetical protein
MNLNREARSIHQRFSKLPGSQYIASEHAIRGLMRCLIKRKPKSVLEIGAGIGTLTFVSTTILSRRQETRDTELKPRIIAVENSAFCRAELRKNLAASWDSLELVHDISDLPGDVSDFDFVIIDGGDSDHRYFSKLGQGATLFVEGYRGPQRDLLESVAVNRRYVRAGFLSLSLRRRGGYWVYQFEPSITDQIHFGLVNFYARVWGSVKYRLKLYLLKQKEQTIG